MCNLVYNLRRTVKGIWFFYDVFCIYWFVISSSMFGNFDFGWFSDLDCLVLYVILGDLCDTAFHLLFVISNLSVVFRVSSRFGIWCFVVVSSTLIFTCYHLALRHWYLEYFAFFISWIVILNFTFLLFESCHVYSSGSRDVKFVLWYFTFWMLSNSCHV